MEPCLPVVFVWVISAPPHADAPTIESTCQGRSMAAPSPKRETERESLLELRCRDIEEVIYERLGWPR
jgi:hypothetical protein